MDERDLLLLAPARKALVIKRTKLVQRTLGRGTMSGQLTLHGRDLDQELSDARVEVEEALDTLNGRNPRVDGDHVKFFVNYSVILTSRWLLISIKNLDRKWTDNPNINEVTNRMEEQIKEKWTLKHEDTVICRCYKHTDTHLFFKVFLV